MNINAVFNFINKDSSCFKGYDGFELLPVGRPKNKEEISSFLLALENIINNNKIPLLINPFDSWTIKPDFKALFEILSNKLDFKSFYFGVFTSGTTGMPKLVLHNKENLENALSKTIEALNVIPHKTTLLALPLCRVGGLMAFLRGLLLKHDFIFWPEQLHLFPLVPLDKKIDYCSLVPWQLEMLMNEPSIHQESIWPCFNQILLGGESIGSSFYEKILELQKKFPHLQFLQSYGMTETLSQVALKEIKFHHSPSFLGGFLKNVKATLSSDSRLILETNTLAKAIVSFSLPPQNISVEFPEVFLTHDLFSLKKDGFFFEGREDSFFVIAGEKILPEYIESLWQQHLKEIAIASLYEGKLIIITLEKPLIELFSSLRSIFRPHYFYAYDEKFKQGPYFDKEGKLNRKKLEFFLKKHPQQIIGFKF